MSCSQRSSHQMMNSGSLWSPSKEFTHLLLHLQQHRPQASTSTHSGICLTRFGNSATRIQRTSAGPSREVATASGTSRKRQKKQWLSRDVKRTEHSSEDFRFGEELQEVISLILLQLYMWIQVDVIYNRAKFHYAVICLCVPNVIKYFIKL